MSQIIPFEQNRLPAHIAARFAARGPSALSQNVGAGYGIVSIKGKVFHIVRGEERTLVTKPGDDDPAASIEVVIIDANPALSKTYYPNGYEEGSTDKPVCYSNDSIAPGADAPEPQALKCSICPHNVFGSRITESGGKGKACGDFRRMAIAPASAIAEPMLLRVPAATLKPLAVYGEMLSKRGVDFGAVVTKIGFDHTVAHPALTFKPMGFIDEAMAAQVDEVRNSDLVRQIIGVSGPFSGAAPAAATTQATAASAPPVAAPAPAPAPTPVAPKPRAARAPAPAPVPTPAPAPVAAPAPIMATSAEPPVPPNAPPMVVNSQAASDIGNMLAGIDFDD